MQVRMHATRNLLPVAVLCACACAERDSISGDAAATSLAAATPDSGGAHTDDTPFRERFGEYTLFYSVVRSDALADEVARRHGVPSVPDAALLNVTVQRHGSNIPAEMDVRAVNLARQMRNVEMYAMVANDLVSYVGVVDIADREVLDFHLELLPDGATTPISFTFRESFSPSVP